jgi:hypothetical protein
VPLFFAAGVVELLLHAATASSAAVATPARALPFMDL